MSAEHASHDAVLRDIASKLPGKPNLIRRGAWIILMAVGLIAFAYLLVNEPRRAWGAYAASMIFFLGTSLGAAVLASAIRLSNGRWAGPIIRIAEAVTAYVPYGIGFVVLMLAVGIWTYLPWTKHVLPRQAPYLNVPFLWIRTLAGLALLWWLIRDMVNLSLRTDAYLLKDHVGPELKPLYQRLCEGWRGDEAEAKWQRDRLAMRAPQIVLTYACFFTYFVWDFIMSLTPNWTSTLFGWWTFMGAFLSGIAMTALIATQLRSHYKLEAYLTPNHFWDLGKIAFGFSIFWVYQFWSQYLPIWYANLPEETSWVFLRFEEPWRRLGFTVFGFVFLLPFVGLMNMYTKKSPFWLALFSLIILSGMWMERHLLIMPSINPDVRWVGAPEVGVTFGFLGVFGWAVQSFLTRYPAVKVADVLAGERGHGH